VILDSKTATEPVAMGCDVCIVGTGAAGLAIAVELLDTGLNVVLLESGGLEFESSTQDLYNAEISGLPYPGTITGRFRVCGGSTTRWAGQVLPLMPHDFDRREWVRFSGWPISFNDLRPYYERASKFLLIDSMNFDSDLFEYLRARPPAFDTSQLWYHFSKWSPEPNIRRHYLPRIRHSQSCTMLLHANLKHIILDESLSRVRSVEVFSLEGRRATVQARAVVLCVGGIETARLLLANNSQQPNGIGNDFDLVGRFFQDHPKAQIGRLTGLDARKAQQWFNSFHKRGQKYTVRCSATPKWQREQRALNISMSLEFVDRRSMLQDLKGLYLALRHGRFEKTDMHGLLRVAAHPIAAASPVWHFFVRGRSFLPEAEMRIGVFCEQEPDPESRILLSQSSDALGMPRANVRWKFTNLTIHTIRLFAQLLCRQFKEAGIGAIELSRELRQPEMPWTDYIADAYHHMGTTRMHDSPRQGVVNRDCRLHAVSNFYIGSSAVFPTGGHSNPTFTIIALSMRIADRLKRELA
jgi:choline dehydrogenase-like flavoprotein